MSQHRHVYGPVPSRRLGRSLGVDLLPFKTCTYDCTYCQLGHTTSHTMERREYVPLEDVIRELADHLASDRPEDRPDIISFAGSGEPTLHSDLGRCIAAIKEMTDVPVAVFTNGSLLWMPEVRRDLALADIVSPSLDAALPATAERANALAPGLDLPRILQGMEDFCREYTGRIWLEIMLAAGINDSPEDYAALNSVLARLEHIEHIQLNTVTRPPADKDVRALTPEELHRAQALLCRPSEIIASFPKTAQDKPKKTATEEEVLELIRCHPSTVAGLAVGLNAEEQSVALQVEALLGRGRILPEVRDGETYYISAREDE